MELTKFLGLRGTSAPDRLKPGALEVAKDVDVDGSGALRTRSGQTSVSTVSSHSLFSSGDLCLVVQGTDMKRMDSSGSLTQLGRLVYGGPVSYAELDGVVYFSNGVDTGRVVAGEVRQWGIRPPPFQPVAAPSVGQLRAGRYLYAMTHVRDDGLESGTRQPAYIDITDNGGISLSSMPASSDPHVVARALYVSGANGEELYRVAVLSAADTSFLHQSPTAGSVVLEAGYVEPAPAGTIVEIHVGRSYVVDGDTVWYSEPYSLERFRRGTNFLRLPGRITMFTSVGTGIFASAGDRTWYLDGSEPTEFNARPVVGVGAILGTAVLTDTAVSDGSGEPNSSEPARSEKAVMWMSPSTGVILGMRGGEIRFLTSDDYGIPGAQRGAAVLRVQRGYATYVTALQGAAPVVTPSAYP